MDFGQLLDLSLGALSTKGEALKGMSTAVADSGGNVAGFVGRINEQTWHGADDSASARHRINTHAASLDTSSQTLNSLANAVTRLADTLKPIQANAESAAEWARIIDREPGFTFDERAGRLSWSFADSGLAKNAANVRDFNETARSAQQANARMKELLEAALAADRTAASSVSQFTLPVDINENDPTPDDSLVPPPPQALRKRDAEDFLDLYNVDGQDFPDDPAEQTDEQRARVQKLKEILARNAGDEEFARMVFGDHEKPGVLLARPELTAERFLQNYGQFGKHGLVDKDLQAKLTGFLSDATRGNPKLQDELVTLADDQINLRNGVLDRSDAVVNGSQLLAPLLPTGLKDIEFLDKAAKAVFDAYKQSKFTADDSFTLAPKDVFGNASDPWNPANPQYANPMNTVLKALKDTPTASARFYANNPEAVKTFAILTSEIPTANTVPGKGPKNDELAQFVDRDLFKRTLRLGILGEPGPDGKPLPHTKENVAAIKQLVQLVGDAPGAFDTTKGRLSDFTPDIKEYMKAYAADLSRPFIDQDLIAKNRFWIPKASGTPLNLSKEDLLHFLDGVKEVPELRTEYDQNGRDIAVSTLRKIRESKDATEDDLLDAFKHLVTTPSNTRAEDSVEQLRKLADDDAKTENDRVEATKKLATFLLDFVPVPGGVGWGIGEAVDAFAKSFETDGATKFKERIEKNEKFLPGPDGKMYTIKELYKLQAATLLRDAGYSPRDKQALINREADSRETSLKNLIKLLTTKADD